MMQGFYLMTMRRMRRRKKIALAVCVLTLAIVFCAFRARSALVPALAESAPVPYIALAENDRLIVTRGGETVIRTAIDIRSLPQSEQVALRKGVELPDAEALAKLLEDYSS